MSDTMVDDPVDDTASNVDRENKKTSRRQQSYLLAVLSEVLLFLLLIYFLASGAGLAFKSDPLSAGGGRTPFSVGSAHFSVSGDTTKPITPGERSPIDLEFTNPNDASIFVTSVAVSVHKVHAPHSDDIHPCTVKDFTVDQAPGRLEVTLAAGETRTLSGLHLRPARWPHVGMLNTPVNQDGCKGASVTLNYTGTGTRIS